MTVEHKVENTILEKGKKYVICGYEVEVAPPTTATLIEVSTLISKHINADDVKSKEKLIEVLRTARGSKIGDIAAVLVLGAKGRRIPPTVHTRKILGIFPLKVKLNYEQVRDYLLTEWRPSQLSEMIIDCLVNSEFAFFLETTIFLSEANMTKKTKTTASGQ